MNKIKTSIAVITLCLITACTSDEKKEVFSSNLYRIQVADKFGFMDDNGTIVIEPQFDEAFYYFSEGVCYARIGEKKGLIDSTGMYKVELNNNITFVSEFINGLAQASFKYPSGSILPIVIDNKGNLIPFPKDKVEFEARLDVDGDSSYIIIKKWIHEGNDSVWVEKYDVMSSNGAIIGDKYDYVWGFSDGLCTVEINDKYGCIDTNGRLVIDTIYDDVWKFGEGVCLVKKNEEYFVIDRSGHRVFSIDCTIDSTISTRFVCNRAAVMLNGEKCLVDCAGQKVSNIDVDDVRDFRESDNLATVYKDNKASLIDTMGNVVLETSYAGIGEYIGGVAEVHNDDWSGGYIDSTGTIIIGVDYVGRIIDGFHRKDFRLRAIENRIENGGRVLYCLSYYDLKGNLIWKDIPNIKTELPRKPEKKDFIDYFDARMTELDPIEGIYYVTDKEYFQNRDNPNNIGLNSSESSFYAVVRNQNTSEFQVMDVNRPGYYWKNKFVSVGESNIYAIVSNNDDDNKYSSEGKIILEDPMQFEFRLEQGHNAWNNFFVTYEFVRDYPSVAEYEIKQKAEWTGTGFAIADGFIATNYHVTRGAKTIRIRGIKGNMKDSYKGFVVASDSDHDISIIKIVDKEFEGFGSIPYSIGKSTVDVGDDVFVLGYPMTQTMGEEVKLTNGIISSTTGYKGDESMYQISAAVQPGNSGGPLFNSDGNVIGVINAKHADAENANYAIKISYLYGLVTSSDLSIDIAGKNRIQSKKLSKKVKEVKDFVYLIECSSK